MRFLLIAVAFLTLTGCVSKQKIKAAIWMNNGLSPELCAREPELHNYGFYRKLSNGKIEFISYCNPEARKWVAMHRDDLNRIMEGLAPKE